MAGDDRWQYCAFCGHKLKPSDLICGNCGSLLSSATVTSQDPNAILDEEPDDDEGGDGGIRPRAIHRFIPARDEKIVKCHKCGGENRRGELNCRYCNYLLVPTTEIDEITEQDENTYRRMVPRMHEDYFLIGVQLIVLKLIKKLAPYPCKTVVQDPDGNIRECGATLNFYDDICPYCGEKNIVGYNCKNADRGCQEVIPVFPPTKRCPSCNSETLMHDITALLNGKLMGEEAVRFTMGKIAPIFPDFELLMDTFSIMIDHRSLVSMESDLKGIANRMAKYFKWLALYLDSLSQKQGTPTMSTIFQNPNAMLSSINPPRRSDNLDNLIMERESSIQGMATPGDGIVSPATQPASPNVSTAGGNDEDDGFDFSI